MLWEQPRFAGKPIARAVESWRSRSGIDEPFHQEDPPCPDAAQPKLPRSRRPWQPSGRSTVLIIFRQVQGIDGPDCMDGTMRVISPDSIAWRTSRRTSSARCQPTGREAVAKGQKRSNREHKKPKADKKKPAATTSASTFVAMPPKKKPGSA